MHFSSPKLLKGSALAILGALVLIRQDVVSEKIQPKHLAFAPRGTMFKRGGHFLLAREAYKILNKWVVHLRRLEPPGKIPTYVRDDLDFPSGLDYMSLGYGLYFRRPGFMLANINNVLSGATRTPSGMMMAGHLVHYKEKHHYAPLENASSPMIYLPYTFRDIKHVYTLPGASLGVIRVTMDGFKDQFKPVNGRAPYDRFTDYPGDEYLPEIANSTNQRKFCYIVMHNYFNGDKMGYNQYQWRTWPVVRGLCNGPICKMGPDSNYTTYLTDIRLDGERKIFGRVCMNMQDRGAPIMCHTNDLNMFDLFNKATTDIKGWKLAYWLIRPSTDSKKTPNKCRTNFYAVDLTYIRDQLFDPGWDQFLEGGVW